MEWKKLISELLKSGLTQAQIANETGIAQPTISALLNGRQKDLGYLNGASLVALRKKHKHSKVIA